MDELKQALSNELSHVKEVWFDQHDNWYVNKVSSAIRSMSREEILGEEASGEEGTGEPVTKKGRAKK